MPEKVTIPYHLVAAGGSSGYVDMYEVPPGRVLKINRIITFFPAGNYGELEVAYYAGIAKVHPKTGTLTGDQVVWDDDVDIQLDSGSTLRLWYRNNNATETREAFIHVLGVLE